jgi:hypothetical protein
MFTNSHILDPQPGPLPIVVGDGYLVAIPVLGSKTKLMVIHNGKPLKVCRNHKSAMSMIKKLKKLQNNSPPNVLYSVTHWP